MNKPSRSVLRIVLATLLLCLLAVVAIWAWRDSLPRPVADSAPPAPLAQSSPAASAPAPASRSPQATAAASTPSSSAAAPVRLPEPVYTSNDFAAPPSPLVAQLQRATELQRGEPVLNPDGSATRIRILKDDTAKYPLLRVTETFRRRDDGRFDPRASVTVATADHILVNPVRPLSSAEAETLAATLGGSVRRNSPLTGTLLIALPEVTLDGVPTAVAALDGHPLVRTAEADPVVYALATVPNDPEFAKLYALHNTGQTVNGIVGTADADMDVVEAWDATTGATTVLVGVIDTGVDWTHPDLKDNIALNPGEIPGNGIDDDNNGFIDDVRGWDFFDNDNNPADEHYHGTHVSGTIAASGNNTNGVVGVAWRAGIVPLRFLGPSGSGNVSDAIECLTYANLRGVRITNNSWGGGEYSQTLHDTIDAGAALPNGGTVFIAAAGNDGSSTPMNPAAYDNPTVLSIAATDNKDALASFSNYDDGTGWVDVAAPGVNIYSTIPEAGYMFLNGTSMATPQVTGIAALILSVTPDLPALDLLQQIKSTVDLKTSLTYKVTTGGRVNAFRALTEGLTIPWPTIASVAVADGGNANGVVNPGEPVTLTVSIRNVSTIAATGLNATLSLAAPDSFVTLGTTAASLGTLAPFETKDAVLTLSVAANTPTPHVVNLHLTTTDSANNTRILPLTFTVYTQSAVTGTVRDVLGVPVAGATVTHLGLFSGETTTAADGTYTLLLVDGSHELTATKPGHTPAGPRVINVPPARSGIDFILSRPNLVLTTPAITATVGIDGRATVNLPLASDGTAPVTYTVHEMTYGYAKNGEPGGVPFNWIDIKNTGTRVGRDILAPFAFWPFNSGAYPMQMDFPFYENNFRSVRVNNLGWLSFTNANRTILHYPSELPNNQRPENMIAFAWVNNKDWPEDGGPYPSDANSMYYQQVDPQTFVMTMNQWALLEGDLITNQVILKRDGSIIIQYGPFTGFDGSRAPDLGSPGIFIAGMQDSDGRRGQTPVYGPTRIMPTDGTSVRMYPVVGAPWLRTSDAGTSIPANGGAHDLGVTLDATGLAPGNYTTTLVLDTNDPDQSVLEVPVTLTVTAGHPSLAWVGDTSSSVTVRADLVLSVQATGDLTGLASVRFYNGDALLGTGTPGADGLYTFTWTNVPAGAHDLRAEAVFADGRTFSTPVRPASGGTGFRVAIDSSDFSNTAPLLSRNRAVIEPFGLPRLDFNTLTGSMYAPVTASITRSGSTATVTFGEGELFIFSPAQTTTDVATISGADQPEYNGTKVITYVDTSGRNRYTFPVTGTPASPATGNIVVDDFITTGVEDGGATLHLTGVGARKFPLNYTITPNTVLEFDFIGRGSTNHQKAVFGIGFDTDSSLSTNRVFHLWGNRANWGGITPYRYIQDALDNTPSDWQHFRIPVGQYFTGAQSFLTFIHANTLDTGRYEMDSAYRNVRLYEDSNATLDHTFTWQITDHPGTKSGEEIYHTWFTPGIKTVSVTATRAGQTAFATRQIEISDAGAFSAQINFQPSTEPIPPGVLPDSGLVFGDRGNGYTYGWNVLNGTATRSNYMLYSGTFERDTHIRQTTSQVWEMAVPNGTYSVYLLYGFASLTNAADSNNNLRVEGVQLVNRTLTPNEWRDVTAKVTVTDGRLTLTSHSNSAALCYMEITRLDDTVARPHAAFTASALGGSAPVGITFDASASFSNLGALAAYSWDFGDDNTATGVNPTHTFAAPGLRTVTLTVTDSGGNTATSSTAIAVQGEAPVATSIALSPATAEVPAGDSISFTAVVKDQYDLPLAPQPALAWQVSGGGTINASGVFIAGPTPGGPHTLTVTSGALSAQAVITVTAAAPYAASIVVTPATTSTITGTTSQFSAVVLDQNGQPLASQPAVTWSVSGGGTIDSAGLFTAGPVASGPHTVTATSGSLSTTASITVTADTSLSTIPVGTFYSISGGTLNTTGVEAVGANFTASSASAYDGVLAQLDSATTLAATGDKLTLTLILESLASNNNQTWSFRYGLFNRNNAPVTAHDQPTVSDDWLGYFAVRHTSTSALSNENGGASDLTASSFFRQAAGTANLIAEGVGGGFSAFPAANGVTQLITRVDGDDAPGGNDGTDGDLATANLPVILTLTIERVASGLKITATPRFGGTGTGSFTFTDTAPTTYTFDALAIGSIGNFRVDGVTVTTNVVTAPPLTPFEQWQASDFPVGTPAADRLPTADPDADGLPNLLEYALGADPNDPTPASELPLLGSGGEYLQFTFLRARADVTYVVEASNDLATWTPIATNPGTVSLTTPVTITDTLRISENPHRFLRLRVTLP